MTARPHVDVATGEPAAPAETKPEKPWPSEVSELLGKAAALCVEHGVDLDDWMRGAWTAYVESRPGYREYLEETQLKNQLEEMRKAGRVGIA